LSDFYAAGDLDDGRWLAFTSKLRKILCNPPVIFPLLWKAC